MGLCFVFGSLLFLPSVLEQHVRKIPIKVNELQMRGVKTLSIFDLKFLSGIRTGDPLFGSWVKEAIIRLKTNPRVGDVSIIRNITGKVIVKITERKPVAIAKFSQLYYLDRDGNILDPVNKDQKQTKNYVIISGPWSKNIIKLGLPEAHEKFHTALNLFSNLLEEGFEKPLIQEIRFNQHTGWTMVWGNSKIPIVFGYEEFGEKIKHLKHVLMDMKLYWSKIQEIDLEFQKRVIVKMKEV